MSCNCNNANKNCEPCAFCTPSGVTGLTTCEPIDPCEQKPDLKCVYYNGPDAECLGIHNGDSLISVLQALLEHFIGPAADCCDLAGYVMWLITTTTSTSTTTTAPPTTTTTTATPECSYYSITNSGPHASTAIIEYTPCNCVYSQQVSIRDTPVMICVDNAYPINVI